MRQPISSPLILDFDSSVKKLSSSEKRYQLANWQKNIRFGCTFSEFTALEKQLALPAQHGCTFLGSGDFHHLSYLLLKNLLQNTQEEFDLVVLDNHPDNMRYPFGIHCGSWVYWASKMPQIHQIYVLGITSADISLTHSWENHLAPLLGGKISYWSIGQNTKWLKILSKNSCCYDFATADELVEAFSKVAKKISRLYLSIDKDVFSTEVIKTNWDQGVLEKSHLHSLLELFQGKLLGVDVTGEVSQYQYHSYFKRLLAFLDGQPKIEPVTLAGWQTEQQKFNLEILTALGNFSC